MKYWLYIFLFFIWSTLEAQQPFALSIDSHSAPLHISEGEFEGVKLAAKNLQQDIERVTDRKPELRTSDSFEETVVLIGTIGKNKAIDQLVESKKLNITDIKDKWEAYLIQIVEKPFPNVDRALVIAGSDKRGTIFGVYEVSKQIGVIWRLKLYLKSKPL